MNAQLTDQIIAQARELGADAAGVVSIKTLKGSPSHLTEPIVDWADKQGSVLILGLAHPKGEPVLDWWDGRKGTEGNRRLMAVGEKLVTWLRKDQGLEAADLPYHADKGGVFLKDSAVLAGLGVIGRNNLFVSPDFGPRLRLRGTLIKAELSDSPRLEFDPCADCPAPCLKVCPQGALTEDGYSRPQCRQQMDWDVDHAVPVENPQPGDPESHIRYCRRCELACLAGKGV